jgi:hypothetical protein
MATQVSGKLPILLGRDENLGFFQGSQKQAEDKHRAQSFTSVDVSPKERLRERRRSCRGRDIVLGYPSAFLTLACVCAYLGTGAARVGLLLFQMLNMSLVVYRSSKTDKSKTMLRCVIGSVLLASAQIILSACVESLFPWFCIQLFFAYAVVSLSDYSCHRFVWHAAWTTQTVGVSRVWWNIVRGHYIHHSVGHHKHSADEDSRTRMLEGRRVLQSKKDAIENRFRNDPMALYALACADHGMSMLGLECVGSFVLTYLLLPTSTVICLLWLFELSGLSILLHAMAVALPIYLNINHDRYHASLEARKGMSVWWSRWFWCSSIMDVMVSNHWKHHDSHRDSYYGVVPFYKYATLALFGTY